MLDWLESFFTSTAGFIVLISILVAVHEYGHFWVARKLGFAVTKFSIGFGKNIWARKGKDGIEYAIGMIPLGGYVAFVDDKLLEEEDKIPIDQLNGMKFNDAVIWKRSLVVAAGPFANFLLAIILLWGLFMYGVPAYKPIIAVPEIETPFGQAGLKSGDVILSIDGHKVDNFNDMAERVIEYMGDGKIEVAYSRDGQESVATVDIGEPLHLSAENNPFAELGFNQYLPPIKPIVGLIVEGGNVSHTEIAVGDLITSINGNDINDWTDIIQNARGLNADERVSITINRNGIDKEYSFMPKADKDSIVRFGIGSDMALYEELVTRQQLGPVAAMQAAINKTINDIVMVFKFVGRLISGHYHINMMGGPLTIANIAGQALSSGLVTFVNLIALLSINIGLLNLLPIPVLDGGRLVGFGIEKLMGKHQFSDKIKVTVLQIGALFMFIFMAIVIYFDITKWL